MRSPSPGAGLPGRMSAFGSLMPGEPGLGGRDPRGAVDFDGRLPPLQPVRGAELNQPSVIGDVVGVQVGDESGPQRLEPAGNGGVSRSRQPGLEIGVQPPASEIDDVDVLPDLHRCGHAALADAAPRRASRGTAEDDDARSRCRLRRRRRRALGLRGYGGDLSRQHGDGRGQQGTHRSCRFHAVSSPRFRAGARLSRQGRPRVGRHVPSGSARSQPASIAGSTRRGRSAWPAT